MKGEGGGETGFGGEDRKIGERGKRGEVANTKRGGLITFYFDLT